MHWRGYIAALALAGCGSDSAGVGTQSGTGTDTETDSGTSGTSSSGTSSSTASATSSSSATSATTTGVTGTASGSGSSSSTGGAPPGSFEACFEDAFVNDPDIGPDYDQFMPTIGSHCLGTNHQDITDIERVVFLGDSITVGTPPTLSGDYYRSRLADMLISEFGLTLGGQDFLWKLANIIDGTSSVQDAGDFSSCAKWGARNDDLLLGGAQITQCFPPEKLDARTLVIMTSGGNDLSALTQAAIDNVPDAELWNMTDEIVTNLRDAVEWFTSDPNKFPNGVFVVFANMPEFTDGTGEVEACDVSALAGFDQPVPSPDKLADMVVWANEQYGKIAVDTGTDMTFVLEEFCGHGFNNENPMAACYRGPNTPRWFDLTCIHPNPPGHAQMADMFMAVVNE